MIWVWLAGAFFVSLLCGAFALGVICAVGKANRILSELDAGGFTWRRVEASKAGAAELRRVARANGGRVNVVRQDPETGEFVEETITADMPDEEIVL